MREELFVPNYMIPDIMVSIANEYNVSVIRDIDNCDKNYGSSAGKEIFLGNFDDPEIELVAFFHELGHTLSSTVCKRGYTMSKMSGEGLAWELGLGIAFEHGYKWNYNSHVMVWARKQLATYIPAFKKELKR